MPVIMSVRTAIGNAQHALHATNGSADTCADGATDHAADRPGCALTAIRTFARTTDDTLRMSGERDRKHRQKRESPEQAALLRHVCG